MPRPSSAWRPLGCARRVEAGADDGGRRRGAGDPRRHEIAFLRREEQVRPRPCEVGREDGRVDQRILLGRRHQHGAIADGLHAVKGRVVAIGPEEDAVVGGHARCQVIDEARHDRAVLVEPARLLLERRRAGEHQVADVPERVQPPRTLHAEPQDADAVHPGLPGRIGVAPRHVVLRRRGQHGHVVPCGEVLGDRSAVRFGSAGHVRAVPVDDARELHRAAGSPGGAPGPRASGRGAQRVDVLPQARVLDRQRLEAREQHEVHLVLPAEVLARVLVEPAVQRQENAPLQEQERAADDRPVRREAQRRVHPPLLLVGQQLGQQQLAAIASRRGPAGTRGRPHRRSRRP